MPISLLNSRLVDTCSLHNAWYFCLDIIPKTLERGWEDFPINGDLKFQLRIDCSYIVIQRVFKTLEPLLFQKYYHLLYISCTITLESISLEYKVFQLLSIIKKLQASPPFCGNYIKLNQKNIIILIHPYFHIFCVKCP